MHIKNLLFLPKPRLCQGKCGAYIGPCPQGPDGPQVSLHNRKFVPGILSKQLPLPLVATSSLSLLLSGVSLSWLDVAPSWLLING